MTSIDYTKLQFATEFNIDKIQTWATRTDSSPNLQNQVNYNFTVPANPSPSSVMTGTGTIPNPFGKKGLGTISWSLDQVNWYPQNGIITYYNPTFLQWFWQMFITIGCSDSTIWICVSTQYTAPQNVYIQFATSNPV